MFQNKNVFLTTCCFFLFSSVFAQEIRKELLLSQIFHKIEIQHQVVFNYLGDEIAVFKFLEPETYWTLEQKLKYIVEKTKLQYNVVNQKYYTFFNDKRLDKPLCGYLLDSETQLPVTKATIHILNTNITSLSDEKGYFELPKISPESIRITHVGYEELTLTAEKLYTITCERYALKPKTLALTEVATTNYLTSGISQKTDGSIIIKPKKMGHLPGLTEPDVFQTIQQIPGIYSADESISNLNIRGGTHDQNLFLWNGIRLFQTGHFFGLISALNPNLAHTVKVVKNGSSPDYGESISGVVDISTHTETPEKTNTSIGINLINADIYSHLLLSSKSDISVSARRSYTDLVTTPTYKKYYTRIFQNTKVTNTETDTDIPFQNDETFYFYDVTAQYHLKTGEKSNLYLDGILISNILDLTQSKLENGTMLSKHSCLEQQSLGGNLTYTTEWNSKNKMESKAYISQYKITSENESIENNQTLNQENDVLDLGIRLQHSYSFTPRVSFQTHYQFNEIGIQNKDQINSPFFSRKIKEVLQTHVLAEEIQYRSKNEKLHLGIGLRGNYFQKFALLLLEPRLQCHYNIGKHLETEILGEQKNQTTSQIIDLQQDFLGIEKRRWVLSNQEDIPILKSYQTSLGFHYKKNNWLLTWDTYYKKVEGITTRSQGFQNQLEFSNFNGRYTAVGTEVLVQKQFQKYLFWASYSFMDNKYNFTNYTPSVFPNNFDIKNVLKIAAIYDDKQFKLAIGAKYHTGKPTTIPQNNTLMYPTPDTPLILYESPNSSRLLDFFQANISGSYTFYMAQKTKLQMGCSIENFTNSKNRIQQYFRINQNTKTIEKIDTYALAFTPNAFIRITF